MAKKAEAKTAKPAKDVNAIIAEKRIELAESRRSNAAGELSNTRRIRELKREIARLLTAQNAGPKTQYEDKEKKS
jgi:ribosomal protein L29